MSQHDLVVDNASGATVRADINAGLQALGSTSKGNSAPSTIYAGQLWIDDNTPSSSIWTLNVYDGSDSISFALIDTTNNWVIPTLGAGSAAAPSLVFSGDTNTGLWSPTGDVLALSTGGTERMRVTSSGNVIVGGTSVVWDEQIAARSTASQVMIGAYSSSASYTSSVVRAQAETAAGTGWQLFQGRAAGGGVVVNIYGNGDIQNTNNSYGAISDERLKENVTDARSYLDDLARIHVRKFSWKAEHKAQADQLGIVAQELAEIFPGLVTETEDKDARGRPLGTTTMGIKYSILVPMLVTAVQELRARVIALESGRG